MDSFEEYQKALNRTKGIMAYQKDLLKAFGPRGVEKLKMALGVMEAQMNQLGEDKSVVASNTDRGKVKEAINLFLNIAVYQPIVPIFRDLSQVYLLIAFNWNKELGRPDIQTAIQATRNIVSGQMTMNETINLLKTVSERVQKLNRYEPPAFELSRHYLKSLEEK